MNVSVKKDNVSIIRRLVNLNRSLDLTMLWCDSELEFCLATIKKFKGGMKSRHKQKFIEAKIDYERIKAYREEVALIKEELNKNIKIVLRNYSSQYQEIFYAYFFTRMSVKQIADKYHYHERAVLRIIELLKKELDEFYV